MCNLVQMAHFLLTDKYRAIILSPEAQLFVHQALTHTRNEPPFLLNHKSQTLESFQRTKNDRSNHAMGKQPVKLKAVVYALSPFQQKVMPGLWKDLPGKIHHKVSENWISATLLLAPLIGTYS